MEVLMELKRISVLLEESQIKRLKSLSGVTRVKMADYIREGVDMVLARYQKELKKAKNYKKQYERR
jgi:hypothetical protein